MAVGAVASAQTNLVRNNSTNEVNVSFSIGDDAGRNNITWKTGSTGVFSAGSNLTVNGAFNGTPTGGTLDLSAVTVIGAVQSTRTISTTSPLSGGGDMSANRTFSIADAAADGATKGAAAFTSGHFSASSGVISLANSGVTAGTHGNSTHTPVIQVDAQGRVVVISNTATAGGGGMGGNYTVTGNNVTSSGNITLAAATDQNIVLAPAGTGEVRVTGSANVTGNFTVGGSSTLGTVNATSTNPGAITLVSSAMGALAVDVTKINNTKTISANSTLTFSATPATGQVFGLTLTNSDSGNNYTITFPSTYSTKYNALITSFIIEASQILKLFWFYDGSTYYFLGGEPFRIINLPTATPIASDRVPFHDVDTGLDGKATITNIVAPLIGVTVQAYNAGTLTKSNLEHEKTLTFDNIADGDDYVMLFTRQAITISEIRGVHFGSGLSSPSVVATVKHGTDVTSMTTIEAVTVTSSTTGTSVTSGFDDATVPADSWIRVALSSKSGTTNDLAVSITYKHD